MLFPVTVRGRRPGRYPGGDGPSSRPDRTAAELLVECLEAERCEYVFSVSGKETMDILDALSQTERIRRVTTRHEQGAAFMADVHGRLTGRCAVAMATLDPDATNLVTGIADTYLDRTPMVAITGQTGSDVGDHKVWAAPLYQAYEPNSVIIPNGFAAMGISLPGAIAAKLVHRSMVTDAAMAQPGTLNAAA